MPRPLLLLLTLLLPLLALLPAAPRPDFAGLYRDQPRLRLDTRREADSLRLYLQVPADTRLTPGRPLLLTAWPSYEAKQPQWQDSIGRRRWAKGLSPSNRLEETVPFLCEWLGPSSI